MTIIIIENATSRIVYSMTVRQPIGTGNHTYLPDMREQAWKDAVSDGLVKADAREKYLIEERTGP